MFGTVLIVIYTVLLAYVFWRASSIHLISKIVSRRWAFVLAGLLWLTFVLGRTLAHEGTGFFASTIEVAGMMLLGSVFLFSVALLLVDLITVFGCVFSEWVPDLRAWAMLAGFGLSAVALVQGHRAPAVVAYEVALANLPDELDGSVLVALSDMHIGSQLNDQWFSECLAQVEQLEPDVIVFLGDIFEGHSVSENEIPALRQLKAPLGKWYVTGNHESHQQAEAEGAQSSVLEQGGFDRLANRWVELVPGMVLAGVDDLTDYKRRGLDGDPVASTLSIRPPGVTVLLSHTPWQTQTAAKAGVDLMLCGHTHGGQIWPFGYLVQLRYPLLAGRYQVEGMTVIVSRGTGTWGPRMRLWRRGEILKVTFRKKQADSGSVRAKQLSIKR